MPPCSQPGGCRAPLGSRTRFRLRPPPHRPRPPPAQQLASDPPAGRPRSPSSNARSIAFQFSPGTPATAPDSAQASPRRISTTFVVPGSGFVPVLWCQWQRRRNNGDRRRPVEGPLGDDHCHPVTRRDPGRANVAGWATKQLPKAITSGASPFRKRSGDPQRDRSARQKIKINGRLRCSMTSRPRPESNQRRGVAAKVSTFRSVVNLIDSRPLIRLYHPSITSFPEGERDQ